MLLKTKKKWKIPVQTLLIFILNDIEKIQCHLLSNESLSKNETKIFSFQKKSISSFALNTPTEVKFKVISSSLKDFALISILISVR